MKAWLFDFLKKGEGHYPGDSDKRRVSLYNFLTLTISTTIIPMVIAVSIINENIYSLLTTIGFALIILVGLHLNWRGYNQIAVMTLAISVLIITYYSLIIVPHQTGAPYGNLLLALTCLLLIKNRVLRIVMVTVSITSFIFNNYVQLKYKAFDETEFLPIVFVILLMFVALLYYDHLMEVFQGRIKSQGEELLILEKERHRQEINLKQKDLENTLAIFSVKDQVTSQLVEKLKEALSAKDPSRTLQRLVIDLQNQNESIRARTLISQNIDEVNAEFYKRLLSEFPLLTKGDRELCAFLRLELSNKEIAQLKNTTENTVNVAKARLRKKLGIQSNKELSRFLNQF